MVTETERGALDPPELFAVTEKGKTAAAVGVPLSRPVPALSVRPPGNAPEDVQEIGPAPLAVNWCE